MRRWVHGRRRAAPANSATHRCTLANMPPHARFDPDAAAAPGSGIFGLPFRAEESRVVILPVPFEGTTSYGGGASRGPAAILAASRQVDLFDIEAGHPYDQ